MAKFKGTGIVVLEKLLNKRSSDSYSEFIDSLSDDEKTVFSQTLPLSWVDINIASSLSEKAAKILFPSQKKR